MDMLSFKILIHSAAYLVFCIISQMCPGSKLLTSDSCNELEDASHGAALTRHEHNEIGPRGSVV